MQEKLIQKYMQTAELFADMSVAKRTKVGAILVKNGSILAHAWNGTPSGYHTNNCELEDGSTNPIVLHAEQNLLIKMATSTESIAGATIFCTYSPCADCAKMLAQAKIKELFYRNDYRNSLGLELLQELGIKTRKI